MWGIIHISKEFFFIFDIVSDTPLINIEAFSTNCFLSDFVILNSKIFDLSTFLILFIEQTVSTCPWQICPEILSPNFKGFSRLISSPILIFLNFDLANVSLDR